jgi:hypothetical protein
VKVIPNLRKLTIIGYYHRDQLSLINSNCQVDFIASQDYLKAVNAADVLDDYIIFDATTCQKNDLISCIIVEVSDSSVPERISCNNVKITNLHTLFRYPLITCHRLLIYLLRQSSSLV